MAFSHLLVSMLISSRKIMSNSYALNGQTVHVDVRLDISVNEMDMVMKFSSSVNLSPSGGWLYSVAFFRVLPIRVQSIISSKISFMIESLSKKGFQMKKGSVLI